MRIKKLFVDYRRQTCSFCKRNKLYEQKVRGEAEHSHGKAIQVSCGLSGGCCGNVMGFAGEHISKGVGDADVTGN